MNGPMRDGDADMNERQRIAFADPVVRGHEINDKIERFRRITIEGQFSKTRLCSIVTVNK